MPDFAYGALTPSGRLSQNRSAIRLESIMQSATPQCLHRGLGSFPFARRYLENRCFFLFLALLRCFSSGGSLPCVMDWRMDDRGSLCRVSPFGYLRIDGYLLLPEAFRSLSRPSSALSAKASTLRSFCLTSRPRSSGIALPDARFAKTLGWIFATRKYFRLKISTSLVLLMSCFLSFWILGYSKCIISFASLTRWLACAIYRFFLPLPGFCRQNPVRARKNDAFLNYIIYAVFKVQFLAKQL